MPYYFLIARNGQETRSHRAYTARDLREFSKLASCYTFIGELTNTVKNVGQGCRIRGRGLRDGAPAPAAPVAPAPAAAKPAAPVAGFWPFGKKKKPQHVGPMYKRMIWEPGVAPRVMTKETATSAMARQGRLIMQGARKRRRR